MSTDLSVTCRIREAKFDLAKQLAYGLSHEINNPLANIATRAQAIQSIADDVQTKQSLQRIVEQSYRAHAMISDLMFYANPPEPRIRQTDLDDRIALVIEHFSPTAERLGITFSRESALETDEDDEPKFTLLADSEMIGEAVAVLVRNSIETIGTGGRIHIRTTTEGQSALIEVSDSGPGITAEQAANAFDPYYSGREAGRGLGLGLCRADRIARLHGGSVTLAPAIAGCVAQLRLPITSQRGCETLR